MAKDKEQPDPLWADQFQADKPPAEGSEEVQEVTTPPPAEEPPSKP